MFDRLRRGIDRATALLPRTPTEAETENEAPPTTAVLIVPPSTGGAALARYVDRFGASRTIVMSSEFSPEWSAVPTTAFKHIGTTGHAFNHIKEIGQVDVIVNAWPQSGHKHAKDLSAMIFQIAHRGLYITPFDAVTDTSDDLIARFTEICAGLSPETHTRMPKGERELLHAVGAATIDRHEIIVSKRGSHLLKLRDADANRILPQRTDVRLRELATRPPGSIAFSRPVSNLGGTHDTSFDFAGVDAPQLHLRHYSGTIGFVSNSLLFTDATILPDSFRHHLEANPKNPRLYNSNSQFARLRAEDIPTETLHGDYYMLDSENSGHFGHLMTEVVSRLWGWDRAKKDCPQLKALFRIRFPHEREPKLEKAVFTAFGIRAEDIVWTDRPVWLESAYAATPQFHNQIPHYIHPDIAETWQRVLRGLPTSDVTVHDKIFVSRSDSLGDRVCRNRDEIEGVFATHGFEVIYPERFSLADQARIFSRARVIAGFGGSAMFNAVFAERLEHMIVLNQNGYTARNEQLITLAKGADLTYFWSDADIPQPDGGWTWEAYRSGWEFDFARDGAILKRTLASL